MTLNEKSNPIACPEIRLLSETELDDANGGVWFFIALGIGIAGGYYKASQERGCTC